MSEARVSTRRLFFALWPDPQVRAQLAAASRRWTKRPVRHDKLHMTLVFLGSRSAEEQACFCSAASQIDCQAFEIQMDYLGGWARAGIQWLGASQVPGALSDLVGKLTAALAACGLEAEKRPFVPHITLARKVRRPRVQAGLDAIRWPVRDFVLLESVVGDAGTRYEVLQHWPLQDSV